MVRSEESFDKQTFSARRNRLNSPPDAIFSNGPVGDPGLVATLKETLSAPVGPPS